MVLANSSPLVVPGGMIGVLGGGQLGRMFVTAAQTMGYRVTVLDPSKDAPAGTSADRHIVADYADSAALEEMAQTCHAVTTEFENVPSASLAFLGSKRIVAPDHHVVGIAQNRRLEKEFLNQHGFETVSFAVIRRLEDLATVSQQELFPGILKSCCFGYDGKGQIRVGSPSELLAAWQNLGGQECVFERAIAIDCEVSAIVARSRDGQASCFPVSENHHRDGILDVTAVPARISSECSRQVQVAALRLANALNYVGVLAVEFFLQKNQELLINEIAPRPHNSGHYTIDACVCSQYEQQVRALCGLPLGDPTQHSPAVMVNILGDLWFRGESREKTEPNWSRLLSEPGLRLHLYGKDPPRLGRKMGHFTVIAPRLEDAWARALACQRSLVTD